MFSPSVPGSSSSALPDSHAEPVSGQVGIGAWFLNVLRGASLRISESLVSIGAPVAFLIEHAVIIGRSLVLLALPALPIWACYRWVPGLAVEYPGSSVRGLCYLAGSYLASILVLLVARLMTRRIVRDVRRGLNDLAIYGAQSRHHAPPADLPGVSPVRPVIS